MFNLIVTVLAIVIMIAVAIAGLSYLGPAFENAASRAIAAQLVNAGQQFAGAEALYKADNGGAYVTDGSTAGAAATALVAGGYLSAVPAIPSTVILAGSGWAISNGTAGSPAIAATTGATPTAAVAAVPATLPQLSLKLDNTKNSTKAVCAEITRENTGVYGCAVDLSSFSFNL